LKRKEEEKGEKRENEKEKGEEVEEVEGGAKSSAVLVQGCRSSCGSSISRILRRISFSHRAHSQVRRRRRELSYIQTLLPFFGLVSFQ